MKETKKKNIYCEHPVILLNPRFQKMAREYGSICIRNIRVWVRINDVLPDSRVFLAKRNKIALSEVDTCYFRNDVTGEIAPLYMVVPCGRCTLCRAKKSRELMFRCVAETNRWNKVPFFITFTYNNKYLPADGVQKRDLQTFFKRLRSRLDYYNIEHNLRYFAVAEYGSKTHRAHYHVILWNFPDATFPSIMAIQHFIEKAWSTFVYELGNDGKKHRVPLLDKAGKVVTYPSGVIRYKSEQLGFIRVLPVKQGCPAYVTKYMRKPCFVPKGCNPVFSLASNRGGGIGSQYFKDNAEFIRNNPTLQKLEIVDKVVSGRTFTCPITQYVKNIVMPTASQKLPKKDYDIVKRFYCTLDLFQYLEIRFRQYDMLNLDVYDYEKECVKHWYDPFTDWRSRADWREAVRLTSCFIHPVLKVDRENLFNELPHKDMDSYRSYLWQLMSDTIDALNNYSRRILEMSDLTTYFANRDNYSNVRQAFFENLFRNAKPVNVELAVERIINNEIKNQHKDVF